MTKYLPEVEVEELRVRIQAAEDLLVKAIKEDAALLASSAVANLLQHLKLLLHILHEAANGDHAAKAKPPSQPL